MILSVALLAASAAPLAAPDAVPEAGPCRALVAAKRAGDAVFAEDLAPAACPTQFPTGLLRFDRARKLTLAAADLAAGAELGLASAPPRPAVLAGETVRVTARIGRVEVTREAVALQAARPGERFFARSQGGGIFVAPAVAATPGENAQ